MYTNRCFLASSQFNTRAPVRPFTTHLGGSAYGLCGRRNYAIAYDIWCVVVGFAFLPVRLQTLKGAAKLEALLL